MQRSGSLHNVSPFSTWKLCARANSILNRRQGTWLDNGKPEAYSNHAHDNKLVVLPHIEDARQKLHDINILDRLACRSGRTHEGNVKAARSLWLFVLRSVLGTRANLRNMLQDQELNNALRFGGCAKRRLILGAWCGADFSKAPAVNGDLVRMQRWWNRQRLYQQHGRPTMIMQAAHPMTL